MTTIAFGIPGSAGMAIILGAFLSQGLVPGPDMLTKNLSVTYSMVWSIAIANIVGAGLCYAFSTQFAKLATLRYTLILPAVVCIIYIGAFEGSRQWGDLYALLGFGALGWVMKRLRWPRAPLILGVVLGDIVERQMFISIQLYGAGWMLRPVVMVVLAIALLGILRPVIVAALRRRGGSLVPAFGFPRFAARDIFPVLLIAGIGYLAALTIGWSTTTSLVPRIVTITAIVAISLSLLNSVLRRGARASPATDRDSTGGQGAPLHMDLVEDDGGLGDRQIIQRALVFGGWLVAFLISMATIGIIPTIPLFVIAYMRIEGRERWATTLAMAAGIALFVYVVFDQLLVMNWPRTAIGGLFPALQIIPSV